ncbi:MAG TPA: hypothetical protein VK728_17595 [Candidatus Sulfotelmatobacter sp.]|jgi:hypothetical protein|nr:hypothetical protein [Candidatus Sulfotelmatobacter sp.]
MPARSNPRTKTRKPEKGALPPFSRRPKKKYSFPTPIPPGTVVHVKDTRAKKWKGNGNKRFRIGYYSRQDGLDCIWLVNNDGEYQETIDHEFLYKFFEIELLSKERSLYGKNRPQLGPISSSAS